MNLPIDQIDVKELLDTLKIEYTESGKNVSNGWIGVQCPFCWDESNHLGINIENKTCSCFNCGHTGTIIGYLAEVLYSYQTAKKVIEKAIPRELKSFIQEKINTTVKVELPLHCTKRILKQHGEYLKSRGFNPFKLYKKYGLLSVGENSEFKWQNRIIIPIYRYGKLVTFTSIDTCKDSEIRYLHEKKEQSIIHCRQLLYGEERTKGKAILVEGIFDLWRIGDGTINTFGTQVTKEQKLLLSKYDEVIIASDGDEAGLKMAEIVGNDLAAFTNVRVVDLPWGKDPDKLKKKHIKYLRSLL